MAVTKKEILDVDNLVKPELANKTNLVKHVRKTPILLYGIFVDLLRIYYSNIDNLPSGVHYRWVPDSEAINSSDKLLIINEDFKYDQDLVENRPAIVVKVGTISYSNVDGAKSLNPYWMNVPDGEYFYSRAGVCPVQFIHLGRTKGEALLFGAATLDYLDAFSKIIANDFCFTSFQVTSISGVSKDEEWRDRYICIVEAQVVFEDTWSLKLESPILKQINMKINDASEYEPSAYINKVTSCCNFTEN